MPKLEISKEDPHEIFTILQKLGEGSYGSVFKALDNRTNQIVAIKVLESEDESDDTSDLQKEINILKTCSSPYVVAYIGTYEKDGNIWIVMEYCGAGSLCDLMAICERTLDEEQIAAVMKMSLYGLEYLHKMKKIHRDIKSGNILLNHEGDCKLADFGVSAELSTINAKRKTMIGTPYWMAPEVLQSADYDGKADIWSLAITAIELAVSEPPHSNVHPMRAIFLIPNSDPPTLPNPQNYSNDFKDFLKVCLQKDAKLRPSATQLLTTHPFILKAKGKAIIAALVSECMTQIDEYREAGEGEGDDEPGDDEDEPNEKTHTVAVGTMVQKDGETSGTMVTGTMVQLGGTLLRKRGSGSDYKAAASAAASSAMEGEKKGGPTHFGTMRNLSERRKSLTRPDPMANTKAPEVPEELQCFRYQKEVDVSANVSMLDLRCQLADLNKGQYMEQMAFDAYYNSRRALLQRAIAARESKGTTK